MLKLYLAAREETLVSIIINGTLPGNFPMEMKQEGLQLFETPQSVVKAGSVNKDIFILEYELPKDSSNYVIECLPDTNDLIFKFEKIDKSTIKTIYVYNKTAWKTVDNILNSQSPVDIKVEPNFYPSSKFTTATQLLISKVETPTKLVTYVKTGDLLASKMQALVNTVNCVGIMGKGIAFSFKKRYPEMFHDYEKLCRAKKVKLGEPYIYRIGERLIINFPTKNHWKNNSKLADIEAGLKYLVEHVKEWGVESMAIPPLGCGNGGLNWEDVSPLISKYLTPLKIPLEIYEPFEKTIHSKKRKKPDTDSTSSSAIANFFKPPANKKRKLNTENEFHYKFDQINTIKAFYKEKEIGYLTIELDGDIYWFDYIEVNTEWRRQGIGTQLIREAVRLFPMIQIPLISAEKGYEGNYKYRLNEDVEMLINHCIKIGIIDKSVNCTQAIPKLSLKSLRGV